MKLKKLLPFRWHIINFFSCLTLYLFINTVYPAALLAKIIFFILVFCSLFSLFYIITKNIRLNLHLTSLLIIGLLMAMLGQFNLINILLLSGFMTAVYFLVKT